MEKVNIADKFKKITEYWKPYIAGELNGQLVKLDKLKGEFVWHHHEHEDELFLVVKATSGWKKENSWWSHVALSIVLSLTKRPGSYCLSRQRRSIPATCRTSGPCTNWNASSASDQIVES